ncbi:MAG TPA: hypothetical protein VMC80_00550 [Patescibacteria group bacterium]|nr:hypothetical protein [Patescibacteria group bacterium]
MVNPTTIGVSTGLLLGVSAIFFSTGHSIIGAILVILGVLLGFWGATKFFRGD